jgi:hypothetical protein
MATNLYQNSANWLNQSGNIYGHQQLTGNPALANSYTYNPALANSASYNSANTQGAGYNSANMQAANVADPNLIASGISRYMNPFTNDVINRTGTDINRMATVQRAGNAASAVNAGAFGGGRQGVVDAITNSEAQKNMGDFSANLRNQGWQTAAGLSAQDIGNQMATGQFNANLLQQARGNNQAATNTARQFTAGNQMQANLANQSATNTARQYNAGNQLQTNFANQGSRNAAGQFNAGQRQNTSQFNASANNSWNQAQASEALQRAAGLSGNSLQGFNMGQNIGQSQAAQGATQQNLAQGTMDRANQQYQGYTGKPLQDLNMFLASLGLNPLNNATTTTQQSNPGMFDWAALIGQTLAGYKSNSAPVPIPG